MDEAAEHEDRGGGVRRVRTVAAATPHGVRPGRKVMAQESTQEEFVASLPRYAQTGLPRNTAGLAAAPREMTTWRLSSWARIAVA